MIFIVCFFSQYEYAANMSDFWWENQFSYGHHFHVKKKTTYIFAESKFESHENKISFDILYFWVKEKLFYKQCRLVRIISKVAKLLYPEGGMHNFISWLHWKWECQQVGFGLGFFIPEPAPRACTRYLNSARLINEFFFVRTYVFHLLGIYVTTICNWLILWQNALYLYFCRFRMCLNTSRNHVLRSSVESFKSVQENKLIVQIL